MSNEPSDLPALLLQAAERRTALRAQLLAENTDAWRIFHGVAEGRPGLSIDRYGGLLLAQVWFDPPTDAERAAVEATLGTVFWRPRKLSMPTSPLVEFTELGLRYGLRAAHEGIDPYLFLDLRPARRWIRDNSAGKRVLNAFAYTCGAGLAAAAGGASRVLNLDHASRWTAVGRENAERNGLAMEHLELDYFAAVRQMAGLPVGGRRGQTRRPLRVPEQRFDLIVLDPPTRSTSPYGTVDIVGDYASLFKPAWLALEPGGALLATNHAPEVDREDWIAACCRCAHKAGRPVEQVERIDAPDDFPSFDGAPPLKMAVFR
jgi:23S rRNA (cytosine1962-C5)-methyltransferase